jgi:hypothetical protein
MPSSVPLPLLFRVLRLLAKLQFWFSALALAFMLMVNLMAAVSDDSRVHIWLDQVEYNRSLSPMKQQELRQSPAGTVHHTVLIEQRKMLVYREPSLAKRLSLALLGTMNASLKRTSTPLIFLSMLTGLLLYRILRDLSLDTPFTETNARRIHWIALLMIGIDVYEFVATILLQYLVPNFPLGDGSQDGVRRFVVLDPTTSSFGSWKFGLVLLVIAAVYKRGVEMAREAELTI